MIYRGIFLRSFPIRENSFIVKILTDQEGSVPVFLRGNKKNIFRKLVFPGTLVDIELVKTKSEVAILNEYNIIRSPEIKSFNQSILLLSYLDIIDKIARGAFESVERVAENIISDGETQFKDLAWLVRCLNEEFYCAGFLDTTVCNDDVEDYKNIKRRIIDILGYLPKSIKLVDKEVYGKNLDF
ncbi:recombination protein O N-terminal domain-containing protein [Thermodesulfobium sp. 4217-1]|uniref:recombination protein O N-terminal domain-containing protein n=1 Tax=Thermodesulfobium sp. 4217-1 TaxID=3120013 RepID=UPI00322193B4